MLRFELLSWQAGHDRRRHESDRLFVLGNRSSLAEQAWLKDAEWAAPLLWRSEFRNVLALYIRKRWLILEESQQIMTGALELMEIQEYDVDSNKVLRLVAESNCSAYECEFVALAQELDTPLITVDKQLLTDRCISSLTQVATLKGGVRVGDYKPG